MNEDRSVAKVVGLITSVVLGVISLAAKMASNANEGPPPRRVEPVTQVHQAMPRYATRGPSAPVEAPLPPAVDACSAGCLERQRACRATASVSCETDRTSCDAICARLAPTPAAAPVQLAEAEVARPVAPAAAPVDVVVPGPPVHVRGPAPQAGTVFVDACLFEIPRAIPRWREADVERTGGLAFGSVSFDTTTEVIAVADDVITEVRIGIDKDQSNLDFGFDRVDEFGALVGKSVWLKADKKGALRVVTKGHTKGFSAKELAAAQTWTFADDRGAFPEAALAPGATAPLDVAIFAGAIGVSAKASGESTLKLTRVDAGVAVFAVHIDVTDPDPTAGTSQYRFDGTWTRDVTRGVNVEVLLKGRVLWAYVDEEGRPWALDGDARLRCTQTRTDPQAAP